MSIKSAFKKFMGKDFEESVDAAILLASCFRESYFVELLDNGCYRLLWADQVDDRYESPGLLLTVPATVNRGQAEREIRKSFSLHWEANQGVQKIISEGA